MAQYVLKPGKQHRHNGENLKPGDVVELTDAQAEAFKDKFDPVQTGSMTVKVTSTVAGEKTEIVTDQDRAGESAEAGEDIDPVTDVEIGKPVGKSTIPQMRHTSSSASGSSSTGTKK